MSEKLMIRTKQGWLCGKKVTSAAKGEYCSFQGIPYAKPPVGPLRFRPPERPEPWQGIWDATKERDVAPGKDIITGCYTGNDDCLFINVYTAQWPILKLIPVMFWIHGGDFSLGSGNTDLFGPDFLVAEDILLVTFNFRLGALGFLSLDDSDVTANNGLRDQVMALTWVQENIEHFGGDRSNVTIFGLSSGGCSAHHMMLLPSAKGLFHRAISMSGTALQPSFYITHDVSNQRAFSLAEILGCSSTEPQEIADFLRTVPAEEIVMNQKNCFSKQEDLRYVPTFMPTEEVGADRFLPDHPVNLLKTGKFNKVPFMTGVSSGEGKIAFFGQDRENVFEIIENLEYYMPWDLSIELGTDISKQIAASLKQFYFKDVNDKEDAVIRYVEMLSDLYFVYSMYESVKLHVKSSNTPVYVYLFDHSAPPELTVFPDKDAESIPGTSHVDHFMYLFYAAAKPKIFPPRSAEAKVRDHTLKLWTEFAKTGRLQYGAENLPWPPVTKEKFHYLKIDQNSQVETDMYKERMEFLDNLYNTFKRRSAVDS